MREGGPARFRPLARGRLLETIELHVRHRDEQQREKQAERLAADDRHGNRRTLLTADASPERRRHQAGQDGARRLLYRCCLYVW